MDEAHPITGNSVDQASEASVEKGDNHTRPLEKERGKKKRKGLFTAPKAEAVQRLRVVYTCPAHSDQALKALLELLASRVVAQDKEDLSTEIPEVRSTESREVI